MMKELTFDPLVGEELIIHVTPVGPNVKPVGAVALRVRATTPFSVRDAPEGEQVMIAPIGREMDIWEWRGEWARVYPNDNDPTQKALSLGGRTVSQLWVRLGALGVVDTGSN